MPLAEIATTAGIGSSWLFVDAERHTIAIDWFLCDRIGMLGAVPNRLLML